jgi:hypothetical protein
VCCLHYIHLCLIILSVIIRHLLWTGFFSADCLFFCRLKINHDSHEFILEVGTITNKTYPVVTQTHPEETEGST